MQTDINWIILCNPRGYSLDELYGIKHPVILYMFGGTGMKLCSEINYPFESSDVWEITGFKVDLNGDIIN